MHSLRTAAQLEAQSNAAARKSAVPAAWVAAHPRHRSSAPAEALAAQGINVWSRILHSMRGLLI